jgi:hypothetical protein
MALTPPRKQTNHFWSGFDDSFIETYNEIVNPDIINKSDLEYSDLGRDSFGWEKSTPEEVLLSAIVFQAFLDYYSAVAKRRKEETTLIRKFLEHDAPHLCRIRKSLIVDMLNKIDNRKFGWRDTPSYFFDTRFWHYSHCSVGLGATKNMKHEI